MKKVNLTMAVVLMSAMLANAQGKTNEPLVTKQSMTEQARVMFSNFNGSVDLTEQYNLKYYISSNIDAEKMTVTWKDAKVINKQTNDTVKVEVENLKCNVLCDNPVAYAGIFEVHYQNQHYIVQFLYDIRTYLNVKKHEIKAIEKCYNVADLDPKMLEKL